MKDLISAAEGMLAALTETAHEKYGGYAYGCSCPRCKLVIETRKAKEHMADTKKDTVKDAIALEREAWLWAIEEHFKECGNMSGECRKKIADKRAYYPGPDKAPIMGGA